VRSAAREIVEGIDNCQILIERAYVKYRRLADVRYSSLIKFIVISLFDYIDFEPATWKPNQISRDHLESLFNRRAELEKFSTELTGQAENPKISNFFNRIGMLLSQRFKQDEQSAYVELLLNKAQLQRIFSILEEIDKQKRESEKYYAPIKEWADALNKFFSQSGKKIEVDSVGKIKVTHNGVNIKLDNLSSGEKQLIILLTHSRFSRKSGSTIIVDEPELSLHLHWQELLVDSLTQGEKKNQFIFATHSPEIVGFRKNYCIRMG
jgi:predicted ATP-dependent endonuclease of OLD family